MVTGNVSRGRPDASLGAGPETVPDEERMKQKEETTEAAQRGKRTFLSPAGCKAFSFPEDGVEA